MSKLQLLYEKLMRIAYIFGGVFFLLSLIDFSAAMVTGAFSCSSGTCGIGDEYVFYQFTILPLIILTVVFFITGFVFFKLAHKESDLLTVSDYKKSLEQTTDSDEVISREELYEKLRRGNRKQKPQTEPFFKKIWASISGFFSGISDNMKKNKERKEQRIAEQKAADAEVLKQEEQNIEKEKQERARTKLNKTALILLLSRNTDLTQNNARLFINSMLDAIKETVIAGEEVKLSKFGRFEKVHIEEHIDTDPDTGVETKVEAHNTVEFFAYPPLLSKLNEGMEIVEEVEATEEEVKEPTVEPVVDVVEETKPEPTQEAKEETTKEVEPEPEVIEEDSTPEPIKEEIIEEPIKDEEPQPVIEKVTEEPVLAEEPEPVVDPVVETTEEVKEAPVKEAPVEVKEEVKPVVKKPAKATPPVKTKKQIIEMMDETTDLSKNKANKFLKFFAEVVKEQLIAREDVELEGIGFFTTIEMPAKEAVNPQTNEKIIVPAHHQVRLRFDEELKDKMNE